ncbi:nitronate monooxygenase [Trebonia kvetii]|uniref:Probable nitronate monooxygenase n=1 Tax=Trebonia kvetii TaxID=2480626 RepID=A0A6P2BRN4_9ACTN|nr:nitronate monooxygenase [Trebonia kvetii]TVZ00876.1 nitronate monooxygenase [Trebonia kvetii]
MILDSCPIPIVLAPLAGGPSTPELAAAVSEAGGLGFLAAGYLSAAELAARCRRVRELTARPFGVNLFVPGEETEATQAERDERVTEYARAIAADVTSIGADLGVPHYDDDAWQAKLAVVLEEPPPVVSFTFGIPDRSVIEAVKAAGSEVWITVTTAAEARLAVEAGADAVAAQGAEAGGHRGGLTDGPGSAVGTMALVQLVTAAVAVPVVAAGGIATGAGVAAALCLGARAAALGTAFLDCPEAGTAAVHRAALHADETRWTSLTRAFSGRTARGIANGFLLAHSSVAPAAYPEVNQLTAPMRAKARQAGLPDYVNLWAGQAYPLTAAVPAADLVRDLWAEAGAVLDRVSGTRSG